jgi:hypothetical protein
MAHDLVKEFVAENDFVLKSARKGRLICIARVPDPCLAHEVEPSPMYNCGALSLHVGAEEDRCTENALEGGYQPSVLCPTLLHAEVKHLRRASKLNRLALLSDRQGGQKDRNEPVLSPRETI